MTLDLKHKVLIGILLAFLVGGALAFRSWLVEHDLRLHAEEQSKAQQTIVAQNQQANQALQALIQQVRDDNAKSSAALAQAVANLKTPNDQLAWVISQLKMQPGQPPITINVPKNPEQPATINVPQRRIPEVTEAVQGCQQCKLDLNARTQELSFSQQQKQKLDGSLKAMTAERDTWKAAAKGGSFWQRTKRSAKWLAIGAGAGAVALCGSGHCK